MPSVVFKSVFNVLGRVNSRPIFVYSRSAVSTTAPRTYYRSLYFYYLVVNKNPKGKTAVLICKLFHYV